MKHLVLVAVVGMMMAGCGYAPVPPVKGCHWKQLYWNGPVLFSNKSGSRVGIIAADFGSWMAANLSSGTSETFETEQQAINWLAEDMGECKP